MEKFVGLIILDGFGLRDNKKGNAIKLANIPFINSLFKKFPNSKLQASGEFVGLPDGQMGNSEVGHFTLGAGRVNYQSLTRINVAIKDGSFYKNEAYLKAVKHAKDNNSKVHILCLASDGGVHSHLEHIKVMFDFLKKEGIDDRSYLHAFLDGRDTPPTSAYEYISTLVNEGIKIGTIGGRYYGMDRDNNFDRIQLAYDAMVNNIGEVIPALEGIKKSYDKDITDEFVKPFIVDPKGVIEDNDSIILLNFRQDRAIRIATALSNPEGLEKYYQPDRTTLKIKELKNTLFVSTMHYADTVKGEIAFAPEKFENFYGDVISSKGYKQIRIAETEKYAHVTFFFDGGQDREIPGSTRVLINSPKVATYDLKPDMSAYEVTVKAINLLKTKKYKTMILNYANPDMVGHTGILSAAISAVETIDTCLTALIAAIKSIGGVALIIADHGNVETIIDDLGNVNTAHTTNQVPAILTSKKYQLHDGGLKDVAPTLLDLLGIDIPEEMTGKSLINK